MRYRSTAMRAIYSSNLVGEDLLLAVTLASYGDDDGSNIFPGMVTLRRDIHRGERDIRDGLKGLRDLGVLKNDGFVQGRRGAIRRFRLDLDALKNIAAPSPTRSEAAKRREADPALKARRRRQAAARRAHEAGPTHDLEAQIACTPMQGAEAAIPCTTVLNTVHNGAALPRTAVPDTLHSRAPLNPYVPVLDPKVPAAERSTAASAAVLRFTKNEIHKAKQHRAHVHGGCPHTPRCNTYEVCLNRIAAGLGYGREFPPGRTLLNLEKLKADVAAQAARAAEGKGRLRPESRNRTN